MMNQAQSYCTSTGSEFFKKKYKLSNDAFNLTHQSFYLSSLALVCIRANISKIKEKFTKK